MMNYDSYDCDNGGDCGSDQGHYHHIDVDNCCFSGYNFIDHYFDIQYFL